MDNPVTITFKDFDELLQFHDLLCDLVSHFKEGAPATQEEIYSRVKNDIEYIGSIRQQIHDQMPD